MLDKLHSLEQELGTLFERYKRLKQEYAVLKSKLDRTQEYENTIAHLQEQVQSHTADLLKLRQENQDLDKAVRQKTTDCEALQAKNRTLQENNHELNEKNALAMQRAQLIQEWLSHIDQDQ